MEDTPKDNTPARVYKRKGVTYEGSDQIMKIEASDIDLAVEQIKVENPNDTVKVLEKESRPGDRTYYLRLRNK